MAKTNNKTKGYNMISRDVVFDTTISDRARFLYVYMACKPDNWDFYQDKVAEELGYKKDTLRKYLDELITRGWITEEEQRNSGQFGCLVYTIEIERRDGNSPIRKNTVSEKNRNGKNNNQRNIYNISSKQSLSDNKDIENKEKKNKTKVLSKKAAEPILLTDEEVRFNAHMQECYPYVQKMNEPLTYAQYMRLHNEFEYTFDQLEDILSKMDNYPNLLKCGRVAYRTALNWLRREYKDANKLVI